MKEQTLNCGIGCGINPGASSKLPYLLMGAFFALLCGLFFSIGYDLDNVRRCEKCNKVYNIQVDNHTHK